MREKLIQTPEPQRDTVFKWSQLNYLDVRITQGETERAARPHLRSHASLKL